MAPDGRGRWGDPGACPCGWVWSRRYVACVPEASFLDLPDRNAEDGAVSVWPAWQVREHGGVTSWFQVRLAFPDGARVDALAVVSAGRVSIEDVQAEPALSLADLTALADWIEGPLFEACGVDVDTGPARDGDAGAEMARGVDADTRSACGLDTGEAGDGTTPDAGCPPAEEPGPDAACSRPEEPQPDAGCPQTEEPEPDVGQPVVSRARPPWPRGIEGRRLVAREYRAAQDEGVDPVLAVMNATGRGRRRALRLIAQARDAGLLAPRHARR
ncbi:DUF6214 family protein [Streptomyces flaveolus]|uniref:DUF6214 family protein n=1 Tax=Streptomyces flaveolus TaxID=67297 RepID=A0ABV3AKD3_9ACTN